MIDQDVARALISIPIPGPFLLLDIIPLTLIYATVAYFDYYLYCQASIPYQKYKNWHRLFHVSIPFLVAPKLHATSTSFIAYSWFTASVGSYASELYKKRQQQQLYQKLDKEGTAVVEKQSFEIWIKSVGMEGLAESPERQPNGTTCTVEQVRKEGLKRILLGGVIMALASIFLTPLLLEDPPEMFTMHWYSPRCIYYGLLMGLKGYSLMVSNDMILAMFQVILGVRVMQVFRFPFLATSVKDFWGHRWNLVVRNLFRKQIYSDQSEKNLKDGKEKEHILALKRLHAFFISALMHETIMTLVNREITFENFAFFMANGFAVYLQYLVPIPKHWIEKVPKVVSIALTLIFLALTSKLFFGPFLRFDEQCIMFSSRAFI